MLLGLWRCSKSMADQARVLAARLRVIIFGMAFMLGATLQFKAIAGMENGFFHPRKN
jgi:hypothetical protein